MSAWSVPGLGQNKITLLASLLPGILSFLFSLSALYSTSFLQHNLISSFTVN